MYAIPTFSVRPSLHRLRGLEVLPSLSETIAPPDLENVDAAFKELYGLGFLTQPNDFGQPVCVTNHRNVYNYGNNLVRCWPLIG